MKSPTTLRHEKFKKELKELLIKHPTANKVEERYKVMRYVLADQWTNLIWNIVEQRGADTLYNFLKDIVYVDRQIRKQTEGKDVLKKKILSQEKRVELGYESTSMESNFINALDKKE